VTHKVQIKKKVSITELPGVCVRKPDGDWEVSQWQIQVVVDLKDRDDAEKIVVYPPLQVHDFEAGLVKLFLPYIPGLAEMFRAQGWTVVTTG